MSNEVIDLNAFKSAKPAKAFQVLDTTESLADGIGSSYPVIGYKGKVWTFKYRGEKKPFLRPEGDPMGYIDVVILRQAHAKSKSYYEDYEQDQSEGKRPICSSLNGVVPDIDVVQKQSETCALCPRNVWHTDASGRKTRDCTDYKRLAVLVLPNQTKALFNPPVMEAAFLRVPPASLDSLAKMGETMSGQGWHYASFVTRISFDVTQAHPKMVFKPLQGLSDKEAEVVLPLRDSVQAKRITGEDQSDAGQRPLLTTVSPPPQITAAQSVPATPAVQAQAAVVTTAAQPAPQVAEAQVSVSTGFLDMTPSLTPAAPAQQAAPLTPSDVGKPQESDDALNARIANILKTAAA